MNTQTLTLADSFITLQHFLQRPLVQQQLLTFVVAIAIAAIIAIFLHRLLLERFNTAARGYTGQQRFIAKRFVILFKRLLFPVLGLIAIRFASTYFASISSTSGLLGECINLFWIFAAYRLVITLLYSIFPESYVARFHHRLLAPLFFLWILARVFNTILSLPSFLSIEVLNVFSTSLTVQKLLISTLGLYFWVDGIAAIRDTWKSIIQRRNKIESGLTVAWLTIGSYVLFFLGFLYVLNLLGVDPNALAFITGGLSVGIGFSMRTIIGNFLSGLILLFERSLKPSDVIEVNGVMATVDSLNIRSTTVRTSNDVEIIIPNETFLTSNVTTYTGNSRRMRLELPVNIDYTNNPEKARLLVLDIANATEGVSDEPAPECFITAFAESGISLMLRVWISDLSDRHEVRSTLNAEIWQRFANEGIHIPLPQRELRIRGEEQTFTQSLKASSESQQSQKTIDLPKADTKL